ncbi:hypothetical protein D3C81_1063800 [compost metagenome]
MVEIDGHLSVIESLDHTWQLGVGSVIEDHQQAFRKFHVVELRPWNDLYVLRVGLTKGVFRLNGHGALVTGLETEDRRFEARQQVAVADFEHRWRLVERAVDGVAVFQVQREVQFDFGVLANSGLSHGRVLRTSCS